MTFSQHTEVQITGTRPQATDEYSCTTSVPPGREEVEYGSDVLALDEIAEHVGSEDPTTGWVDRHIPGRKLLAEELLETHTDPVTTLLRACSACPRTRLLQ